MQDAFNLFVCLGISPERIIKDANLIKKGPFTNTPNISSSQNLPRCLGPLKDLLNLPLQHNGLSTMENTLGLQTTTEHHVQIILFLDLKYHNESTLITVHIMVNPHIDHMPWYGTCTYLGMPWYRIYHPTAWSVLQNLETIGPNDDIPLHLGPNLFTILTNVVWVATKWGLTLMDFNSENVPGP